MLACPKCGYIRKQEDTAPECQCPHCQIVYAKYLAYQEKRLAQQKVFQRQQTEFVPISFLGKCLFFIGLAVIVELFFSVLALSGFFLRLWGVGTGYIVVGLLSYYVIYSNQLWSRLPHRKKINWLLVLGIVLYFIRIDFSTINVLFDNAHLSHYLYVFLKSTGLIIILSSLMLLSIGAQPPKLKESQPIKTIYLGVVLFIYYFMSALPLKSLLFAGFDYSTLALLVFNLFIAVVIAAIFIKKTRLAERVAYSSSAFNLIKAGNILQILIWIAGILIMIIFKWSLSSMQKEAWGIIVSIVGSFVFLIALCAAKIAIFFGVLNVIFDTFLPKPRVINKTS